MIDRIVSFALSRGFLVVTVMLAIGVYGAVSFNNLPIDAYPDLSPPQVQVVSQWPGHAAEEVERQITIPLEVELNGIPKLDALRSLSIYGLSSITMNFDFDTDPYLAGPRPSNASRTPRCRPASSPACRRCRARADSSIATSW